MVMFFSILNHLLTPGRLFVVPKEIFIKIIHEPKWTLPIILDRHGNVTYFTCYLLYQYT
jgi:hypothetical protein